MKLSVITSLNPFQSVIGTSKSPTLQGRQLADMETLINWFKAFTSTEKNDAFSFGCSRSRPTNSTKLPDEDTIILQDYEARNEGTLNNFEQKFHINIIIGHLYDNHIDNQIKC